MQQGRAGDIAARKYGGPYFVEAGSLASATKVMDVALIKYYLAQMNICAMKISRRKHVEIYR